MSEVSHIANMTKFDIFLFDVTEPPMKNQITVSSRRHSTRTNTLTDMLKAVLEYFGVSDMLMEKYDLPTAGFCCSFEKDNARREKQRKKRQHRITFSPDKAHSSFETLTTATPRECTEGVKAAPMTGRRTKVTAAEIFMVIAVTVQLC